MAWQSLNDVYIPKSGGGDIEGSLSVSGNLVVNDGSGKGTTYDVASEISDLKSAWDSISQSLGSMYVGYVAKGDGNTSFTITFDNEVCFRTLFVLFGMANSNIPIFTIIGLQLTNDNGYTPMATYKNLMTSGVTDATVNGRTLTITLDARNWGDLYGMCSAGSFTAS